MSGQKKGGGGCQRKHPPSVTSARRAWGLPRFTLPERQRGPHPLLARGSNTGGRNLRFDPPEYGSRGSPQGSYVVRKGAIPKMPCREDLLRGAEAPRMEPRRFIRTSVSLSVLRPILSASGMPSTGPRVGT